MSNKKLPKPSPALKEAIKKFKKWRKNGWKNKGIVTIELNDIEFFVG